MFFDQPRPLEEGESLTLYKMTVFKGRSRSSSRNATITKPEKPKLMSKHLAPVTPRTWSTSTTLLVPTKRQPLVTNYALGLAVVKTWQQIMNKEFGIKKAKEDVGGSLDVRRKGKRKIYYRALIATTLRDLIGSNRRLIAEDPAAGVSQVAMPRPPCPTMQDLYDRMGNMKIHQGQLERMSRRQSYHFDRYYGVFKHMAGHYRVLLQGVYTPPRYDEEPQQQDQE
nr:hypothetical protein [Tanacetum cinerariifolium]